jgi:hypothetical protein
VLAQPAALEGVGAIVFTRCWLTLFLAVNKGKYGNFMWKKTLYSLLGLALKHTSKLMRAIITKVQSQIGLMKLCQ